jgi:exonuclease SbcC
MKIRKIRFKNINSLRGEHEVDFTKSPLQESRLFAITGPTGSGKSTFLDVISLALFSQVPRLGKITKKIVLEGGALLTRNTEDAYASVEYECSKGVFRSTWKISTSRNKTLRDYEMEITELASSKNLDLKKSAVPTKNEELIGLTYDQFIKSILLAQGDFAKFLQVNKSERGELLEKITGTGIYRILGKKAFEKKNLFAKALEELRKEESFHQELLMEANDFDESQKRNKELARLFEEKEINRKRLEDKLKVRLEVSNLEKSSQEKQEELKGKKLSLTDFEVLEGLKIKAHEATSPFAEKLGDWSKNIEKLTIVNKDTEGLNKDKEANQSKRGELLKEVSSLLKIEVDPQKVKASLAVFQNQVIKLQRQIDEKKADYRGEKAALSARAEDWGFTPSASDPELDLNTLEALRTEVRVELRDLEVKLKGLSLENTGEASLRLDSELKALQRGEQWSEQVEKIQKNIGQERAVLTEKVALEGALPARIEKLRSEKEKEELRVTALQLELENQKLRASLEEKRAELQEGEPCSLCGSMEHPWASHAPEADNELNQKLLEAKKKLQLNSENQISAEEQYKSLGKAKEDLAKRIKSHQDEIEDLQQKLKSECQQWLGEEPIIWQELINQVQVQRESLKTFIHLDKKAKDLEICLPIARLMIKIVKEGKQLKIKKEALFLGEDISKTCGTLNDSWLGINHQLQSLQDQFIKKADELKTLNEVQRILANDLTPNLKEKGFAGIDDAISKRLPEEKYHQLNLELGKLKDAFKTKETELNSLQERLLEQKGKLSAESFEELKVKKEGVTNEITEIRESWEEVKRLLKNHDENLLKLEGLKGRITTEEKTGRKWELLNQLIGDANGKRFNDFAQDLTLQQLLALANIRLAQLIDRYQIASPRPEEDDSLVAVDNHMGGQRRSVKTLSGGETFILSLSLALALSDLAAKNVEINSLFIDEGFGTLDSETLDQTIDTLEKFQSESSKTIGIISHVEALKERIGTQIQLERNGQGYSSLKVV